ncbi:MAG: hypothetical protein ABH816_01240 [Candidatus Levyibacteriota bacterium]
MFSKGLLILVLLVAGLVFAFVLVIPKIQNKDKSVLKENDSAKTETSHSAPEQNLNWKTYENLDYRLHFQYPSELTTEELKDLAPNYLQINILEKSQKAQAIFMAKSVFAPEEALNFVGSSPQDNKTINGLTWDFYSFPQGYSNSPPFTVYQGKKANILYSFKFYNLVSDEVRDQIMGTIEIMPPPQNN